MIGFILRLVLALLAVGFIGWLAYIVCLGLKAFCLRKPLRGSWDTPTVTVTP